jgi:hypothetical protein
LRNLEEYIDRNKFMPAEDFEAATERYHQPRVMAALASRETGPAEAFQTILEHALAGEQSSPSR